MFWKTSCVSAMTDEEYAAWFEAMEPEKRARVGAYQQTDDRRRSVCADHLAREMLAEAVGCAPSEIVLGVTPAGKPFAVGRAVELGISHSGDRVLCAVSDRPVGVDIQRRRPVRERLLRRVCASKEAAYVGGDAERFFEVWTFKEAVFKCRGTGFTGFADVDFFDTRYKREFHLDGEYTICIVTE